MADSKKTTIVERGMATLAAKCEKALIEAESVHKSLRLYQGQRLFMVARTFIPGRFTAKYGRHHRLNIMSENIFKRLVAENLKHGRETQVICEMILDGDNLTVTQHLESVVLQEGNNDVLVTG